MSTTRILFVGLPQFMQDLIEALVRCEPDIAVIGNVTNGTELAEELQQTSPDIIISAAEDGALSASCRRVLDERRHVRFLALSPAGEDGEVHELVPRVERITEVSPEILLRAIRGEEGSEYR